jgi:hypothetical protein
MEKVKRMTNRPYSLRIPEGVLQLAELRGHEERTDKTTALRQWLYAAAEEYALKRLADGRLTLSQTAELLDLSVYDVQQKVQERGIELGATAEQYRQASRPRVNCVPNARRQRNHNCMTPRWDTIGRKAS